MVGIPAIVPFAREAVTIRPSMLTRPPGRAYHKQQKACPRLTSGGKRMSAVRSVPRNRLTSQALTLQVPPCVQSASVLALGTWPGRRSEGAAGNEWQSVLFVINQQSSHGTGNCWRATLLLPGSFASERSEYTMM